MKELKGETKIIHDQKQWTLEGVMDVDFGPPVRLTNEYTICKTDNEATWDWDAHHPSIGT